MKTTKTITVIGTQMGYEIRNNREHVGYTNNVVDAIAMAKKVDNTKNIVVKEFDYKYTVKAENK